MIPCHSVGLSLPEVVNMALSKWDRVFVHKTSHSSNLSSPIMLFFVDLFVLLLGNEVSMTLNFVNIILGLE